MYIYWAAILITALVSLMVLSGIKSGRLKRQLLLLSLVLACGVILDYFLIPEYWSPKTSFDIPVGLEGYVFTVFLALVSFGLWIRLEKNEHLLRISAQTKRDIIFCLPVLFIALLPVQNFIKLYLALFLAGTIMQFANRTTLFKVIRHAAVFLIIYFCAINSWALLFPEASEWFNAKNLSGIVVVKVIAEELVFAICFAVFSGGILTSLKNR